jgi:predicted permease
MRQNRVQRFLDEIRADLRYAIRSFLGNKVFTLAVMATLALGMGANTAVFSVADAVLIKELPVRDPEELVIFYWLRMPDPMVAGYSGYGRPGPGGAGIRTSFSHLTFERFRDHNSTLSSVFAIAPLRDLSVNTDGRTDTASADLVSGSYFAGLGVQAFRGRTLTSADDRVGAEPVAVISYRYWQRLFNSDPAILGKTIDINRAPVAIVGVTPEGFHGTRISESTDITIAMAMASRVGGQAPAHPISMWWLQIMGRLKPGITREQALADVQRIFGDSVLESWAARTSNSPNQTGATVPQLQIMSGGRGPDGPRLDALPILAAVFIVAGAVLLIGCVNVANLVLMRASARRQEICTRLALGASRQRVVQQLLTESLLLALGGAVAGTLFAFWGNDFLTWFPTSKTPIVDAKIDLHVLAFVGGLSVLTAILFGVGPALRAAQTDLSPSIRPTVQHNRGIVRRSLVAAQVAICLLLLVVAGLFLQTLHNLSRVDVGFDAENLLVFRISSGTRSDDSARVFQLYEELISGIEAVPGVRSATMSMMPVLARAEWSATVRPDSGREARSAYIQSVRPNFFETMGIPLLRGRGLLSADREGSPRVAVINEMMAKQVFNDPSPIGRHFQFVDGRERNVRVEVVGIVRDSAYARLQEAAPPTLYMPHRQLPASPMTFEVRTALDSLSLVPAIQQAVERVDRALPLSRVKTQQQQIEETIALPNTFAVVTSAFGVVGLVLACIGLYGIVSFNVKRRTNEIGIRMALGAQRSDVVRLVLRETTSVVLIGAGVGLALALVATKVARNLFFGVALSNPIAIVSATLLLAIAAGLAGYLPARRASGLDPTQALRYE